MGHSANSEVSSMTGRNSGALLGRLRSRILAGAWSPGDYLPTVRQLSVEHGVAHNTAWRALKALEAEGLVAAQSRRGYRVLAGAAGPLTGGPLAYVLSRENIVGGWDLLYRRLLESFEELAALRGCRLMKVIMSRGEEKMVLDQLSASGASGVILDSSNKDLLRWTHKSGALAVVVDDWRSGLECDAVLQDNFVGGELAVRYLIEEGAERIAWFGRNCDHHHSRARYGGAAAVLAGAGMRFSHEVSLPLDSPDLEAQAEKLLRRADRRDGLVVLWRPMAAAVAAVARRLNMKIGKDFRMVGWCCQEAYDEGYAPLFEGGPVPSAITWSVRAMAERALSHLAERVGSPKLPPVRSTVPVKLKEARQ